MLTGIFDNFLKHNWTFVKNYVFFLKIIEFLRFPIIFSILINVVLKNWNNYVFKPGKPGKSGNLKRLEAWQP